jgi:hypothetical protein
LLHQIQVHYSVCCCCCLWSMDFNMNIWNDIDISIMITRTLLHIFIVKDLKWSIFILFKSSKMRYFVFDFYLSTYFKKIKNIIIKFNVFNTLLIDLFQKPHPHTIYMRPINLFNSNMNLILNQQILCIDTHKPFPATNQKPSHAL